MTNHDLENLLENLVAPALTVLGFELICCRFIIEDGRQTLRILIDNPQGLTSDDCIQASRQIGAILDVEAIIDFPYDLEVSSPGLDRPLITVAHFRRFIDQTIKIKLHEPVEDQRHFTGQLLSVTEQIVQVLVGQKTIDIQFDNIDKANLVYQ